ncbi:DUF1764 family protein [Pseudohyphozyma bogoriensis]|nr:DUF1764 family protein [Pseudohyphozyma bogoriensis]
MAVNKTAAATTVPPPPSKKRVASEIDDIFASKKTKQDPASAAPTPSTSTLPDAGEPKKKKKKKDGKGKEKELEVDEPVPSAASGASAKRVPETIVDSSAAIEGYKPPPVVAGKKRKAGDGEGFDIDADWADSRGANRPRTEDGLPIFQISELRIGLGGDTELCPFDCQCCF